MTSDRERADKAVAKMLGKHAHQSIKDRFHEQFMSDYAAIRREALLAAAKVAEDEIDNATREGRSERSADNILSAIRNLIDGGV